MRILPIFILPRTVQATTPPPCTRAKIDKFDDADAAKAVSGDDTKDFCGAADKCQGYFLTPLPATFGCRAVTNQANTDLFPPEHNLKKDTDGKTWLPDDEGNYVNAAGSIGTLDVSGSLNNGPTNVASNKLYWHLHGELFKSPDDTKNICFCDKLGETHIRGRGNWKNADVVANGQNVVYVSKTQVAAMNTKKICLCDTNGVNTAKMDIVGDDTTKLLKHGEVGDGAKLCANLLYQFDGTHSPLSKQCADTTFCDQFAGTEVCIAKTAYLYNTKTTYTQATTDKTYCVRRLKVGPADATFTATDQTAYRPTSTTDTPSKDCISTDTVKYYCNSYGDGTTNNERCLDTSKVLGDDNVANAVRKKGTATEDLCLGVGETGAHKCLATEQCNPHAGTNDALCVPEKEVLGHAEAGNDASDPVKQTCIADNEVHATCSKTQICNYGAGAAADVCLPNTKLIGAPTITAATNNWNAIKFKSLRVQPAKNTELCIARAYSETSFSTTTAGGKSFSDQCSDSTTADEAEICNPNATALVDVCVKKNTVVAKHGDQVVDETRVACIGDTHYKLNLKKDTICNFNAASVDDVEVLLADTLAGSVDADKNIIAGGFNKVGEKTTGELNKWCFDQTQAARCTDKQTCNPAGTYADNAWTAGTDEKATCVDTEKLIEHGAKGDDTKMFCLGSTGASKYTVDAEAETPEDQCSRDNGELHEADEQLADGALVDADILAAGGVRCFATSGGLFYDASCKENYACNPTGSSKEDCGTEDKACSLSNICIFKDARLTVGGKFDKEAAPTVNICLAGAVATECDEAKPYCQEDGTCAETAASGSDAGGEGEGDNASGSSTASLVGLSVAAILSA